MGIRYANRKDANHAEIREGIEALGWSWFDAADYGCPFDAIVGAAETNTMVEIKDPDKPPSARKLTPKEQKFRDNWRGGYVVVYNLEELIAAVQAEIARRQSQRVPAAAPSGMEWPEPMPWPEPKAENDHHPV